MWTMTQRCIDTLSRSHVESKMIEVLHDGQTVKKLGGAGDELPPVWNQYADAFIPALDTGVNVARQKIRRDGFASFLDLDGVLTPNDAQDLFVPLITDIRIWQGIHYHDATVAETLAGRDIEWIPIGTLVVTDIDGDWPVRTITGFDRLWHLSKFVGNWPITGGTPLHQALVDILSTQIPAGKLSVDIPEMEFDTNAMLYAEQTESLDVAHEMATAMGLALYANPMGTIVAKPEPSTEDPAVMTYAPGPRSMLLRPSRGVSARDIVNVVVFTGEDNTTATVVRAVAEDSNPNSLTYVERVGRFPTFMSSPLIRTFPQAQLAANTALMRRVGLADTTAVPVVPNSALEAGDVLQVSDPSQGINFPLIADSFPAGRPEQVISTRSRVLR